MDGGREPNRRVEDRLKREHQVSRLGELGAVLGLEPRRGQGFIDDRDVHGFLRRREVFGGDEATHAALRRASDGIEHGYLSFGDARDLVDQHFGRAAAAIRHSILRESGLAADDVEALMTGEYARPLPLWRPQVLVDGQFAEDRAFNFQRPVHVRVDGAIRTERIVPDQHTTIGAIDTQVRSFDGLAVEVGTIGLIAPGELQASPREADEQ